jgi:hypothetical protein
MPGLCQTHAAQKRQKQDNRRKEHFDKQKQRRGKQVPADAEEAGHGRISGTLQQADTNSGTRIRKHRIL